MRQKSLEMSQWQADINIKLKKEAFQSKLEIAAIEEEEEKEVDISHVKEYDTVLQDSNLTPSKFLSFLLDGLLAEVPEKFKTLFGLKLNVMRQCKNNH